MNHGGGVRRGSLVRDAKSGNTPARDLNNYNDVLDIDADGVYGAETGLFADGGSVTKSYKKGGATDVTVNNWSEIPEEYKKIRLPKKVDWDINPNNEGLFQIVKPFLGKDELRPAMQGINYDQNGITVTNAHILLTLPLPKSTFEGVYKPKEIKTKISASYPKYEAIIPKQTSINKVLNIDILKLLTYCKVASNYSGNREITFKINDSEMSFSPDLMIDFLSSLIKLTGGNYYYVGYQTNKQPLIFTKTKDFELGDTDIALIMPFIYGKENVYGTKNLEKNTELNVYFDFDDNEIRNANDSIVDLSIKPATTRKSTTKKTTESKTKTSKSQTTEIDLINKKIWIGDNPELSKKVQEFGFQKGFVNAFGTKVVYTNTSSIFFGSNSKANKYIYVVSFDKKSFDAEPETEIFEADLFPSTTEKAEKFTDSKIGLFEQIDEIIKTNNLTEISERWDFIKTPKTKDFDVVDTITGDVYTLRSFQTVLGYDKDDANPEKVIKLIKDYLKWKSLKSFATDKSITDEDIKVKNLIEKFIINGGWSLKKRIKTKVGSSYEEFYKSEPPTIFTLTPIIGEGLYPSDEKTLNFLKKVGLYEDYKYYDTETESDETSSVEQPKLSQTEKPKRNFELERKYLSQRISDLAKELDLKRPILSNEEVAFYQREINSFILKLRKLNDAEMNLKPIEERVRGVYDLKISSFESQYPETDMTSINALKSQLTEKEYFNVRTPEFKSFFGDWETAYLNNSYAGVSKVINPVTKEPQPVFHGTNVLFVNWKTYETNNAHYFAVKREFSEFFATTWEERTDKAGVDSQVLKKLNPNKGNFLMRCFIDVKNPIDFSRFGVDKYPIREFLTFLRVNYNIGDFDFWTNIASHSGITQDTEVYAWQIIRLWQSFTKYVKVFTTYDGYIFYEYIPTKTYGGLENASLSYCAFDSNQIKFTDAYEFNALSNDSRFDLGGIL
jgi:hypothetical protein